MRGKTGGNAHTSRVTDGFELKAFHRIKERTSSGFCGRTVTAVIMFPSNKILLVKRGTLVFKGYWALPGGRVDAGETVEQAVIREVEEETGLNLELVRKIGEYHENGVQDGIEHNYYPTCFLVKPIGGEIKPRKGEIEQVKPFNQKSIPERLAFEHSSMIEDILRIKEMARLTEIVKKCRKCRLHKTRINAVPGEGPTDTKIVICGQAPGRREDEEGRPFVGAAGKFLNKLLDSIELKRERAFITSPVKCFPPKNRPPKPDELRTCKPYLEEQIRIVNPKIIIALGNTALQTLLECKLTVSQLHGESQQLDGIIVFPSFHPAAAMRFPKIKVLMEKDFKRLKILLNKSGLV